MGICSTQFQFLTDIVVNIIIQTEIYLLNAMNKTEIFVSTMKIKNAMNIYVYVRVKYNWYWSEMDEYKRKV